MAEADLRGEMPPDDGPFDILGTDNVYYVAISRARQEARIYTDDAAKLPFAIERERPKHAALDIVRV